MKKQHKRDGHRTLRLLRDMVREYPQSKKLYAEFRDDREGLGGWPDYVWCPMAGAYAIVSGGGDSRVAIDKVPDIARVAALGAWRVTQGIYRFDADLAAELVNSPLSGDLPCALLHRLPQWCVYIETSWLADNGVFGFFAHLEYDVGAGREELRLLIDTDEGLLPVPLHLGPWDLRTALDEMGRVARGHSVALGLPAPGNTGALAPSVAPFVSLVLYLCADEADYERPSRPRERKGMRATRLSEPEMPSVLAVGVRMGAALRAHRARETTQGPTLEGARARPIGHIRSSHWHTFWRGPLDGVREKFVKWLPPMGVNLDLNADPTAVIRPVKR